jgi:U4/U6.U5 tri-snRNP-associated protein 1
LVDALRLRISLGLKPLVLDSQPNQIEKERQNHEARKRQEAESQAAELRKKLQE